MGSMKEEMMQEQENNRDKELARILGITIDELDETGWELEEITDSDDNVVDVIVRFNDSSPKNILSKIEGLDNTNTVWLGANPFEAGEDEKFEPDEK